MKQLTEQQLKDNYDKLRNLISETFTGERLEKLNKLYDDFEDRIIVAPASGKEEYHYCHIGGYVEHILHVVDTARKVSKLYEQIGGTIEWTDEELVFAALHHDLGKVGDLEQEHYIPQENDWRVKNLGEIFVSNTDIQNMRPPERGLFILQHYGIVCTLNETLGIKLADGIYDDSNEYYLKVFDAKKALKNHLPYILHWADHMSTQAEYDEWRFENKRQSEKVALSVNKIKGAVDNQIDKNNEVKEKFNTKTTDAKDIFNELFGEPKK